jgi:cephalosporin hydroxylase
MPSSPTFELIREVPPVEDDREGFAAERRASALALGADSDLAQRANALFAAADRHRYSYVWTWLGVPIIQIPADIVATQEIIWTTMPTLIVETGVARGGSAIFHSSILELRGHGRVIGIDIDIRAHNRRSIEEHPLARRIELIEGSSLDPEVIERVTTEASMEERVMVVLDSNHTHDHVLAELRAYANLVTLGAYLIVADTIVEHIAGGGDRRRPWGPGDNPATALAAFLAERDDFAPDDEINGKLLLTSSPGGYLVRTRR